MKGPGIIKSDSWIMDCDTNEYLYVWAPHWDVVTDKMISDSLGIEGFRSTEKWQLIGRAGEGCKPGIIIPGCQVKSWLSCDVSPTSPKILVIR